MGRKPTTSRSEIEALEAKGLTREEIADLKGVTESGLSWHMRHTGGKPPETMVERLKKSLPWEITGERVWAAPYRWILLHLEFLETRGKGMSDMKIHKLKGFYRTMTERNSIVRYAPDIPPHPGQKFGGFQYVPRTESDEDLILRLDEYTRIPAESRDRWRVPPREDWPE